MYFRRFPVISGFQVHWDSRKNPGNRVVAIWKDGEIHHSERPIDGTADTAASCEDHGAPRTPVENKVGSPLYTIVTREYMAQGHDGYQALHGRQLLIDEESGQLFSAIVRRYLLGTSSRIPRMPSLILCQAHDISKP